MHELYVTPRPRGGLVRATWELIDTEAGLPKCVDFLNDGNVYFLSGTNRMAVPAPPPHNRGYVEAAFRTSETTNTGSCLLPTHFRFTRCTITDVQKTNANLAVFRLVSAFAVAVRDRCTRGNFVPAIDGVTLLADRRVSLRPNPIPEMGYFVTNAWLDVADARWQALYQHELQIRETRVRDLGDGQVRNRGKVRKIYVMWAALIGTSGAFVFIVRNFARNKHAKVR